ncbi:MAG: hypothetical protein KAS39_06630, partial [Actinomycetia bacterium]|nr:hypothetical protein [Actinomycetes bacterium]
MKLMGKIFIENSFIVFRKYLSLSQKYFLMDSSGTESLYMGFRDPYKIRSDFHLFDLNDTSEEFMIVKDDSLKNYNASFQIFSGGEYIGFIKKDTSVSRLKHQWFFYDINGEKIAYAQEDSWVKALFRRFVNIPLLGNFLQCNVRVHMIDGEVIASFDRILSFFDKFQLLFYHDCSENKDN